MSEKAAEEENPSANSDRRRIIGLILFLCLLGVMATLLVFNAAEPTSGDLTVSNWLAQRGNDSTVFHDPARKEVILRFGPESIRYFMAHYRSAVAELAKKDNWLTKQKAKWFGDPDIPAGRRKNAALIALTVLAQKYPAEVDPFFQEQLKSPRRQEIFMALGYAGPQYFHFLTNTIAGPDPGESSMAMLSLSGMSTNAQAAVPLVVNTITNRPNAGKTWWFGLFTLAVIGPDHEATLPTLFRLLRSPHVDARWASSSALASMTNQYDVILPEFVRVAREYARDTNGIGSSSLRYIRPGGLAPEIVVPFLINGLARAIETDGASTQARSQTIFHLEQLSEFKAKAKDAIPLVKERLLPLHTPPPGAKPSKQLRRIEEYLRAIDRNWRPR
ncbi:MAG: hypothetical protein ACPGVU_07915 [Limisphaerales bacterium]